MMINKSIDFTRNAKSLTVGVELEFQVLDKPTLNLTPRAEEILNRTSLKGLTQELFQSTLEFITPVMPSIREVEHYYRTKLSVLRAEGEALNLTFAGTGTHPLADYRDRLVTPTPRYESLVSKNKWLIRRMAVYGMHIHFGMKTGDECIRFHNFFMHLIPHLIALSASSPFWHGVNTELASCRPTMYEALPTAGIPYPLDSWKDFENLLTRLIKTDSVASFKDLWWDIRPSPLLGTIEIRVCDGAASLSEMLAIASFLHAAAHWFEDHHNTWLKNEPLPQWMIRENKWRAIRNGLNAKIIVSDKGETRSIRADIEQWIHRFIPYYSSLNYNAYLGDLNTILTLGNSSERQNKVFLETNSLQEVVRFNVEEFKAEKALQLF
ncbi:MAG TPA: YbdK family carboxylate-amine ligase [Ohtaekwangia sp.]